MSQEGKVFIVTGATSGVGYRLASILDNAGGNVDLAGHSEDKAMNTIEALQSSVHNVSSASRLTYLPLYIFDLGTIKTLADSVLSLLPEIAATCSLQ